MMTQGAAQHSGRQMGMTAAPPFSPLSSFDLEPLSAAYEALKYWPWALSSASRAFTSSLFLEKRSPAREEVRTQSGTCEDIRDLPCG